MITADKPLIDAATADCLDDEDRARVLREIADPDWSCLTATIGDPAWGEFVPEVIADRWGSLPDDVKLMLFIVAKGAADRSPGWDAQGEDC